ncbi:hypothetical protein [Methylobacterium sp. 22177]|uniref:hypothetical protein n=1 Tax=Methylobacterium sp. 22177 TaxID=3453885 RepID=UPI003F86DDEF
MFGIKNDYCERSLATNKNLDQPTEDDVADRNFRILIGLACSLAVSACGTTLPIMDVRHPDPGDFNDFVQNVVYHVRCELRRALKANTLNNPKRLAILKNWSAKIALNLKAMDEGTANPSVTGIPSTIFSIGATGSYKADATREMTMTYFLTVQELLAEREPDGQLALDPISKLPMPCQSADDGFAPIGGDLGIEQTMAAAFTASDNFYSLSDVVQGGPFDTISHHVNFTVIAGATVTPTWKFVKITANTSGSFLGANRTTYDDLLITLGPSELGTRKLVKGGRVRVLGALSGSSELDQSFFVERLKNIFSSPRPGF